MTQHMAVATSLVVMVPTGFSATMVNVINRKVHVRSGIVLATAASAGMYLTARFISPQIDEKYMRYIFATVMGVSALRMLI